MSDILKKAYLTLIDFKRFMVQSTFFIICLGVVFTLNVEKHFISLNRLAWGAFIFCVVAYLTRPIQDKLIVFLGKGFLDKIKPFVKNTAENEKKEVLEATDKIFSLYKDFLVSIVAVFTLIILYAINYKADLASKTKVTVSGQVKGYVIIDTLIAIPAADSMPADTLWKKQKKVNLDNAKVYVHFLNGPEEIIPTKSDGKFSQKFDVKNDTRFVIMEVSKDGFVTDKNSLEILDSNSVKYFPILQKKQ